MLDEEVGEMVNVSELAVDPKQFMEGLLKKINQHVFPAQIEECLGRLPALIPKNTEAIDGFEQKDPDHIAAAVGEIVDIIVLAVPEQCPSMKPVMDEYVPLFTSLKMLTPNELKKTLALFIPNIQRHIAMMRTALAGNESEYAGENVYGHYFGQLKSMTPELKEKLTPYIDHIQMAIAKMQASAFQQLDLTDHAAVQSCRTGHERQRLALAGISCLLCHHADT
jgi:hypothetical protein